MLSCFFISNQPKEFPWEYGKNPKAHEEYTKQLIDAISVAVKLNEITTFCCGLAHSVDLDFAEAVLYQKENKYPNIRLICLVDNGQASDHWNEQDAERYKTILSKADEKQPLPDVPPIENAEQVIAVWNGQESGAMWNVLHYTMLRKSIYFIRLNDIKEDTDEPNGRLKRELREAEEASKKSIFTIIGYTILIKELIAGHPDPKSAFKTAIKNNSAFAKEIARLADTIGLDLTTE